MNIRKFEGLIAAPFSPMDRKGNLNPGLIPEYYSFLEKNGVAGAFINGSTGEGASLSQKEKQLQVIKWSESSGADGKVRIINLVGGTSYQECIENAILAYEAGLSAVAITAPYYFKPVDIDHLAEFITRIGENVPEMPVYFYHVPSLTGVSLSMAGFLEKISVMLPNFAGIKYTHDDYIDFLSCLKFSNGKYDILWGKDESILPAFLLGCRGAVGSTINYAAPLYKALLKAIDEGNLDEAGKLQQKSVSIVMLLDKYGGISTGKVFMRYIGLDCGKFRSPVNNMPDDMYEEFVKDVRKLDIDRWLCKK